MTDRPESTSPYEPETDLGGDDFFMSDVAIEPPLDEFCRTFAKKIRSFEGDGGDDRRAPYYRAFELGHVLIRRQLGLEDGSC